MRKTPSQQQTPLSNSGKNEDKARQNQLQTIFQYLQKHVATASIVAEKTGIPQKNICRYKRDMEKAGHLWEVRKDRCSLTGFKAWYLTTDPQKAPKNTPHQLTLF